MAAKKKKAARKPKRKEDNANPKKGLKEKLEESIGDLGGIEPLHLLTCFVNGFDPRPDRVSPIYSFMLEVIEDRGESPPTVSQWKHFKELCAMMRQPPVTSDQSQSAAKELLAYQFPKLKAMELTATGVQGFGGPPKPLTKDEVKTFEAYFKKEY